MIDQFGGIIGHGQAYQDFVWRHARARRAWAADLLRYRCSHSIAISGDAWPNDVRLSELEPRFICGACGHRGADVRPDFNWNRAATAMMGYR